MYKQLKPEVKALWLQALLSGAYPQGRNYLHRLMDGGGSSYRPGYCCLGVLCDISGQGQWLNLDNYGATFVDDDGRNSRSSATQGVLAWSGLDPLAQNDLAAKNDAGASFETIAQWIDENL